MTNRSPSRRCRDRTGPPWNSLTGKRAVTTRRRSSSRYLSPQKGTYTVTTVVLDPGGLTANAVIDVMVTNLVPKANPDETTALEADFIFDPLVNDSDPENGPLTIQIATVTSNFESQVVGYPDNKVHILLVPGVTTLDYTIHDAGGLTSSSTISITFEPPPVNRAPVVPDVAVSVSGAYSAPSISRWSSPSLTAMTSRLIVPLRPPASSCSSRRPQPTIRRNRVSTSTSAYPTTSATPAIIQCIGTDPAGLSDHRHPDDLKGGRDSCRGPV